jgi:outer membrane protein OmpA-like peptidoglycan-associated protein
MLARSGRARPRGALEPIEEVAMNPRTTQAVVALAFAALAGCATVSERDPVVADARGAVYAARIDPKVATYAPLELEQAIAAMNRVEQLVHDAANVDDVHRVAYVARERATVAQEKARIKSEEAAIAAANAERQRIELAARAREAEQAKQSARDAQYQAELSRRQAEAAREQASAAQRQAELAQQQAANAQDQAQAVQQQAQSRVVESRVLQQQLIELAAQPSDRGFVVTLHDMLFDTGRATLQPGGVRAVHKLADFLNAYPERTIAIEGFADSSGNGYANQQLSERRAQTVQLALIDMGIDARRIVVRGYGEAYPVASNSTPAGRQMNRRVEVVISDRAGAVPPRG